LRILRIIGEFGGDTGTGPARQAYLLTKELAARGVYSTILTYHNGGFDSDRLVGLSVYTPLLRVRSFHFSFRMLTDSLKAKTDLIHVHGYRNFQTDVGALTSLLKDRPLIMTSHGSILGFSLGGWSPTSMRLHRLYDRLSGRLALKQADVIVATTRREASELVIFGVPPSKIRVVPNSIVISPVDPKHVRHASGGKLRLLMVTRITYIRNLELAIEGFALALRTNKNMVFDIVGDEKRSSYTALEDRGYKERLWKLCVSLQIAENVTFSGWVFGAALLTKYENSDIFLWTSRYDSFGAGLVEAASFGLPIISTDVGVASDIIDNGRGGFLVSKSPLAIAEAILRLAGDHMLRSEMGAHNSQKAREFSPKEMTAGYLSIYEELLGNRHLARKVETKPRELDFQS
jgi:glycosyltransferase involved in cell wall biosynthesis